MCYILCVIIQSINTPSKPLSSSTLIQWCKLDFNTVCWAEITFTSLAQPREENCDRQKKPWSVFCTADDKSLFLLFQIGKIKSTNARDSSCDNRRLEHLVLEQHRRKEQQREEGLLISMQSCGCSSVLTIVLRFWTHMFTDQFPTRQLILLPSFGRFVFN